MNPTQGRKNKTAGCSLSLGEQPVFYQNTYICR